VDKKIVRCQLFPTIKAAMDFAAASDVPGYQIPRA
jgi:hypothetical protein